MLTQCWLEVS